MVIPDLIYRNVLEMDSRNPRDSLLRILTMTSWPVKDKTVFSGEAMFAPIEECDKPLVKAHLSLFFRPNASPRTNRNVGLRDLTLGYQSG